MSVYMLITEVPYISVCEGAGLEDPLPGGPGSLWQDRGDGTRRSALSHLPA